MKKTVERLAAGLQALFGWGIFVSLFAGGLSFVGYGLALVLGGAAAQGICRFIYTVMYPVLVQVSTVSVVIGLVGMYLRGETALSARK